MINSDLEKDFKENIFKFQDRSSPVYICPGHFYWEFIYP